jgi:hypothetical protein
MQCSLRETHAQSPHNRHESPISFRPALNHVLTLTTINTSTQTLTQIHTHAHTRTHTRILGRVRVNALLDIPLLERLFKLFKLGSLAARRLVVLKMFYLLCVDDYVDKVQTGQKL